VTVLDPVIRELAKSCANCRAEYASCKSCRIYQKMNHLCDICGKQLAEVSMLMSDGVERVLCSRCHSMQVLAPQIH
jgi:recombinational DNA repair protein RecR